jgi:hypothetical protein
MEEWLRLRSATGAKQKARSSGHPTTGLFLLHYKASYGLIMNIGDVLKIA